MSRWFTPCPECSLRVSKALYVCPGCGEDLRRKCRTCGLPLEGEEPVCGCWMYGDPEPLDDDLGAEFWHGPFAS